MSMSIRIFNQARSFNHSSQVLSPPSMAAAEAQDAEVEGGVPLFGQTAELASMVQSQATSGAIAAKASSLSTALSCGLSVFGKPDESMREKLKNDRYVSGIGRVPQIALDLALDASDVLHINELSALVLVKEIAKRTPGGASKLPRSASGAVLVQLLSLLYSERICLLDALRSLLLCCSSDDGSVDLWFSDINASKLAANVYAQLRDAFTSSLLPVVQRYDTYIPQLHAQQLPQEQLRLLEIALLLPDKGLCSSRDHVHDIVQVVSLSSSLFPSPAHDRQNTLIPGMALMLLFQLCGIAAQIESHGSQISNAQSTPHEDIGNELLSETQAHEITQCFQATNSVQPVCKLLWAIIHSVSCYTGAPLMETIRKSPAQASAEAQDAVLHGALEELETFAAMISSSSSVMATASLLRRQLRNVLASFLFAFSPRETEGTMSYSLCSLFCSIFNDDPDLCLLFWKCNTCVDSILHNFLAELRSRSPAEPEEFLMTLCALASDRACADFAMDYLGAYESIAIPESRVAHILAGPEFEGATVSFVDEIKLPDTFGGIRIEKNSTGVRIAGLHSRGLVSIPPQTQKLIDGVSILIAQTSALLSDDISSTADSLPAESTDGGVTFSALRAVKRILCADQAYARTLQAVDPDAMFGKALAKASMYVKGKSIRLMTEALDVSAHLCRLGFENIIAPVFEHGLLAVQCEKKQYSGSDWMRTAWMPVLERFLQGEQTASSRLEVVEHVLGLLDALLCAAPREELAIASTGVLVRCISTEIGMWYFPSKIWRYRIFASLMRALAQVLDGPMLDQQKRQAAADAIAADKRSAEAVLMPLKNGFDTLNRLQHTPCEGLDSEECDATEDALIASLALNTKILQMMDPNKSNKMLLIRALFHGKNDDIGPRLLNVAGLMHHSIGSEIAQSAARFVRTAIRFASMSPEMESLRYSIPSLLHDKPTDERAHFDSSNQPMSLHESICTHGLSISYTDKEVDHETYALVRVIVEDEPKLAEELLLPQQISNGAAGVRTVQEAVDNLSILDEQSQASVMLLLNSLLRSDTLYTSIVQPYFNENEPEGQSRLQKAVDTSFQSTDERVRLLSAHLHLAVCIRAVSSSEERSSSVLEEACRTMQHACEDACRALWSCETRATASVMGLAAYDDYAMHNIPIKEPLRRLVSECQDCIGNCSLVSGCHKWELAHKSALSLGGNADNLGTGLTEKELSTGLDVSYCVASLDCVSPLRRKRELMEPAASECFPMQLSVSIGHGPFDEFHCLSALSYDPESRTSLGSIDSIELQLASNALESCFQFKEHVRCVNDALVKCRLASSAMLLFSELLIHEESHSVTPVGSDLVGIVLRSVSNNLLESFKLHEHLLQVEELSWSPLDAQLVCCIVMLQYLSRAASKDGDWKMPEAVRDACVALDEALGQVLEMHGNLCGVESSSRSLHMQRVFIIALELSRLCDRVRAPEAVPHTATAILSAMINLPEQGRSTAQACAAAVFFLCKCGALSLGDIPVKRLMQVHHTSSITTDASLQWLILRLISVDVRASLSLRMPAAVRLGLSGCDILKLACEWLQADSEFAGQRKPRAHEGAASACIDIVCDVVESEIMEIDLKELVQLIVSLHQQLSAWMGAAGCNDPGNEIVQRCAARACRLVRACIALAHAECQLKSPEGVKAVAKGAQQCILSIIAAAQQYPGETGFTAIALALDVQLAFPRGPPAGYSDRSTVQHVVELTGRLQERNDLTSRDARAAAVAQQLAQRLQFVQ